MSVGLALLCAWIELGVVVAVLAYFVLRSSETDPFEVASRDLADEAPARDSWEQ